MLITVDEENLINSDIANRRKRIIDSQLIDKLGRENEKLKEKIDIAVKALEFYADESHFSDKNYGINGENEYWYEGNVEDGSKAQKALEKIKEIR